ncbi:NADH-quinone oxidoreductase subunit J [Wenzhouxiangella sp. XN24]|uniref:NADH-quinone oxidoreductase subunit J n=1 Tax=Wenzhouxiangella sp. XN24 TaxID=2713569 RepID=UPI0013EB8769|nr:NADH-quinone oxidoreductase subunit J [Wenzhouxiangella sp. XN24]
MIEAIIFYVFGAILLGAAIGVIASRNAVHSAMFLVLSFFTSAFLWLLLEAEFLAIVLVLVYVGAVMVLFLFVVMMLDVGVDRLRGGFTRYAPLSLVVVALVMGMLGVLVWSRTGELSMINAPPRAPADYSNTEALGAVLYTEYVYAFELAAVLLLVAIVAAITLTMRKRPDLKVQDIGKQVATRRQDRVRLVRMDAEKDE